MTAHDVLQDLTARGIIVTRDGDTLRLRAPRGTITPGLREALTQHKTEILDLLAGEHHDLVADACRVFPGSRILDGAESYFEAFRALAQRHYPDLAPWDRLEMAFRGLAQIIAILAARGDALGEARARAVWFLMTEFCDRHRGVAL